MAMYIPTNKKTGVSYPAISEDDRKAYEAEGSAVRGKFTFKEVKDTAQKAPPPIEAKQVPKKEED